MSQPNVLVQESAPKNNVHVFEPTKDDLDLTYLVIGSGPVGIRFCAELLKRSPLAHIIVFGNEPYQPYNRIQLSSLLAGEVGLEDIITKLPIRSNTQDFHMLSVQFMRLILSISRSLTLMENTIVTIS